VYPFSYYDNQPFSQPTNGPIQDASGATKTSTGRPCLATNGVTMLLTYPYVDPNKQNLLGWATRSLQANPPAEGAGPSTYKVNMGPWIWQGPVGDKILGLDASIQADQDFLYMAFRSNDAKGIWQGAYQGLENLATGDWIVNRAVVMAKTSVTPQCQHAPALVIDRQRGVMVFQGYNTNAIFWAWT